jgi:hypothetical protein
VGLFKKTSIAVPGFMMSPKKCLNSNEFNGGIQMRRTLLALSALVLGFGFGPLAKADAAQPKDWTFLVFLNGNNNLDSFGALNINQMEKIGSTGKVNVVVQWASLETHRVKRLLIKKDNDSNRVTSPVIQDMGSVDMGDWHSVVDFVKWGVQNYPANHYFVDIWDHGSGWHSKNAAGIGFNPMDISWDDLTGNHMTTKQMAMALDESAKVIGHKIDLYASDACLMAMVEIANEVKDSVSVYAGSEETEPGAGWPYDTFLQRWNSMSDTSPQAVAKALSEEYAKSYQRGSSKVTFSAFDLQFLPAFNRAMLGFSKSFQGMNASSLKQVAKVASKSQYFTNADYVDAIDFLTNLKSASIPGVSASSMNEVNEALKPLILTSNNVGFPKAHGMTLWIPTSSYTYNQYADLYSQLSFDHETRWSDVLKSIAH